MSWTKLPDWEPNLDVVFEQVEAVLIKSRDGRPVSEVEYNFNLLVDKQYPAKYKKIWESVFGKAPVRRRKKK